jgi:hypothetical protein
MGWERATTPTPPEALKPISLNQWLCTLFLPPEGFQRRVLIPFAGVMSEGIGALLAGFDEIVAVEMEADYCDIGRERMAWWEQSMRWGLTDVEVILKWWSAQKRREAERQEQDAPEQLALFGGS